MQWNLNWPSRNTTAAITFYIFNISCVLDDYFVLRQTDCKPFQNDVCFRSGSPDQLQKPKPWIRWTRKEILFDNFLTVSYLLCWYGNKVSLNHLHGSKAGKDFSQFQNQFEDFWCDSVLILGILWVLHFPGACGMTLCCNWRINLLPPVVCGSKVTAA